MTRSRAWLTAVAVVGSATLGLWSLLAWQSARHQAATAAADLQTCQTLERQITLLRDQPRQAQAAALQQPEMARRIEKAAQQAGIDPRNLERIAPEEPRRLGDSVYLESPTQITLSHATLGQVVGFLHNLAGGGGGGAGGGGDLRVQSVRLGAPRGSDGAGGGAGSTWRAEITVSYWVYAPKTTPVVLTAKD